MLLGRFGSAAARRTSESEDVADSTELLTGAGAADVGVAPSFTSSDSILDVKSSVDSSLNLRPRRVSIGLPTEDIRESELREKEGRFC